MKTSLAVTGIRTAEPPTRSVVATPTDLLRVVVRVNVVSAVYFPCGAASQRGLWPPHS